MSNTMKLPKDGTTGLCTICGKVTDTSTRSMITHKTVWCCRSPFIDSCRVIFIDKEMDKLYGTNYAELPY